MQNIPLLTVDNCSYDGPRPYAVTKVTLFFLDGTAYPMKLYFPRFTQWMDPHELTSAYLAALVSYWCKYWLNITGYQISLGSVNPETGEETYTAHYDPVSIPLDKVYMPGNIRGEWIDPEQDQAQQSGERLKQMIKSMNEGRHPLDGAEISSNTGPLESWNN